MMLGLVMLVLGFAVGSEPGGLSVSHQSSACHSVISTSWFTSEPGPGSTSTTPTTPYERRVEARCDRVEVRNRWLTWGALGVGGVLALVGWTMVREGRQPPPVRSGHLSKTG